MIYQIFQLIALLEFNLYFDFIPDMSFVDLLS